uniref:Uncharacterized protein n=1 Tax=Anguilla anguilla TaxID=7936 RepID=A0A0E9SF18_ANGAN
MNTYITAREIPALENSTNLLNFIVSGMRSNKAGHYTALTLHSVR